MKSFSDVLIVGFGYVGKATRKVYPDAQIWDPMAGHDTPINWKTINLVIVCVPTPSNTIDGSCDTTIVEDVVKNFIPNADDYDGVIMIKSTVAPGTTSKLVNQTGHDMVFCPEYIGEGGYWVPPEFPNPTNPVEHGFSIIGGHPDVCSRVIDGYLMPILGPSTRYRIMNPTEAELVKYFTNTYLALKVVWANEMRKICDQVPGVNYHVVREGWQDDPRAGTSHSAAFPDKPGFDGKCFPKDMAALRAAFRSPFLEAIENTNKQNLGS